MNDSVAIKVDRVSKEFKLPHEKQTSIKGALINLGKTGKRKRSYERQQVLNNISFEINHGDFFGILGRNGSGKSTLLKMLAGIYMPTVGSIQVNGKLTPFIELGVGFNPELTGRENVFLNGALLGFNRKEMNAMYQDIVDFAEIEKFMDQKLKNYSSGMQVRLAFSIAIRANTPILLLDEVLAVGDALFQQKCFEYFKQLKKDKKTVILVSHDINTVQQYCNAGILIDAGNIVERGKIDKVVSKYRELLLNYEDNSTANSKKHENNLSHLIEITSVQTSSSGAVKKVFSDEDSSIDIKVSYKVNDSTENPIYGVIVKDSMGQQIFASNTLWSDLKTGSPKKNQRITVTWSVPNVFNTGKYTIDPAVSNDTGSIMFDWGTEFSEFKVRKSAETSGVVNINHKIGIKNER